MAAAEENGSAAGDGGEIGISGHVLAGSEGLVCGLGIPRERKRMLGSWKEESVRREIEGIFMSE